MEMDGWELGMAESITIVMLIGLSVDYVVHLANHYVESTTDSRFERIQASLRDLGISILSGASTTIGSGTFLFFATIIMFNKFAALIYLTITFSLLYSLIFNKYVQYVLLCLQENKLNKTIPIKLKIL